jgi:hypothetical protein
MACPLHLSCQLSNKIQMRSALRVWQSFYCDGIFSRCERYKLAEAGREVPVRLLPNGRLQEEPFEPEPAVAPYRQAR